MSFGARALILLVLPTVATGLGCKGEIGRPGATGPSGATASGAAGAAGTAVGAGAGIGGTPAPRTGPCVAAAAFAPPRLWRLNDQQYANVVHDVFGATIAVPAE